MIKKISKTVLTSALVFLLSTGNVLAQNWIAPAGSPPGNNVPAPVNIGGQEQSKSGKFTVNNTFSVNGDTILGLDDDAGLFTNFLQSYFFNNTNFGDPTPFNGSANEIPVDVSIFGKLKYQTADNNGNPMPFNPGYVLQLNDEDYAEWVDPSTIATSALAPGNILGQFYSWDGDSWELTTHFFANEWGDPPAFEVKNGGTLFVGDNSYVFVRPTAQVRFMNGNPGANKILADNGTGQGILEWKTAGELGLGSTLPPGQTNGETLRWDAATQLWERTNMLLVGAGLGESVISTNPISTKDIDLVTNNDATAEVFVRSPKIKIMPSGAVVEAGDILSAADEEGAVTWSDPLSLLPDGVNDGDILIWNGTTWIVGPNTGEGGQPSTLPNGTTVGNTLRWNGTAWVETPYWKVGFGDELNDIATNYNFVRNLTLATRTDNPDATLMLRSPNLKIQADGDTDVLGNIPFALTDDGEYKWNKNFRYITLNNTPQAGIDTTALRLENPQDPDGVTDPNIDVTVFVNDGLTVLNNDTVINGATTINNTLSITGDTTIASGGDLFLQGISAVPPQMILVDGVPTPIEDIDGFLKDLCVRNDTKEVVLCKSDLETHGSVLTSDYTEVFSIGTTGVTFPRPNQAGTNVHVVACAAGGGGGGGGYGSFNGSSWSQGGPGGGGGGGGAQGDCASADINVSNGSQLSWSVGQGGQGGPGAMYTYTNGIGSSLVQAGQGSTGGPTIVFFNGNQLLSLSGGLPGDPGLGSTGPNSPGIQGCGTGDQSGCIGSIGWDDGTPGTTSVPSSYPMYNILGSYSQGIATITGFNLGGSWVGGVGGYGGHGEPFDGEEISQATPGVIAGGNGGRGGFPKVSAGSACDGSNVYKISNVSCTTTYTLSAPVAYGKRGGDGSPSAGGGGGGGSSGMFNVINGNNGLGGGNGGNGGPGYIELTYTISEAAQETSQVYSSPGTYAFDTSTIPSSAGNVTFRVWGAGGGGGGSNQGSIAQNSIINGQQATYNSVWDRNGGGGGAGAYVEYSVQRSALVGNLNITVGGGGAGGVGSSGGSSTSGGNGNSSHLTINGVNVVASGGVGGYVAANNNPCTVANAPGGSQSNGSSGGTITSGGYGGDCGTVLVANNAGYRLGGQNSSGYGNGGDGARCRVQVGGSSSISQCLTQGDFASPGQYKISQPGYPGRVEIDW